MRLDSDAVGASDLCRGHDGHQRDVNPTAFQNIIRDKSLGLLKAVGQEYFGNFGHLRLKKHRFDAQI